MFLKAYDLCNEKIRINILKKYIVVFMRLHKEQVRRKRREGGPKPKPHL